MGEDRREKDNPFTAGGWPHSLHRYSPRRSTNKIYASSGLTNWTIVDSFVNDTGTAVIVDPAAATVDRRFYRVQAQ